METHIFVWRFIFSPVPRESAASAAAPGRSTPGAWPNATARETTETAGGTGLETRDGSDRGRRRQRRGRRPPPAGRRRPRDDGDRRKDWFRVATVSLIAFRVSTSGFRARGKDSFRVATVSLIAFRVSTLGFCARRRDWFRVATVSLIAFRVSTLGFCARGKDWFRVARVSRFCFAKAWLSLCLCFARLWPCKGKALALHMQGFCFSRARLWLCKALQRQSFAKARLLQCKG